jgi:toxin ParE1/3/4
VAFQILWSDSAQERLFETLDFIAEENPEAAKRVSEDILRRLEALAEHPRLGRRLREGIDPDLRRFLVGNYIVVYQVREASETIFIVGFRHSRQRQLPEEIW